MVNYSVSVSMKDSFPSKRVMSEHQAVNSNQKLYEWYSEAHNINVLMKKFQNTVELQRLVKQSEDITISQQHFGYMLFSIRPTKGSECSIPLYLQGSQQWQ